MHFSTDIKLLLRHCYWKTEGRRMGRYQDTWVVDKVLFDYVNQGGCSCCGMSHFGMDLNEFMALCSDVNSDDARKEKLSPWPKFMHDQIWQDRVKFRVRLKSFRLSFKEKFDFSPDLLLENKLQNIDIHESNVSLPDQFYSWWINKASNKVKKSCFILPKSDLTDIIRSTYDFGAAYHTLLCSVLEQVQNFMEIGYVPDASSGFELYFEACFIYQRKTFQVKPEFYQSDKGNLAFLKYLQHLTTRSNLPKEEGFSNESIELDENIHTSESQSFRSDRRLLRLVIFRFFAEQAWRLFKKEGLKENTNNN